MSNPFINAKTHGQVDPREYHKQDYDRGHYKFVMSRGELFKFARNPRKWRLGAAEADTKSTEWGSLMDCLVLQAGEFSKRFVSHPRTYVSTSKQKETKPWTRRSNDCDAWCSEKEEAGLTVIHPDVETAARDALHELFNDREIVDVIATCKVQQMATACYQDAATGLFIDLKMLADIVPANHKALIDFKTGKSANPNKWPDEVFKYGLHLQAAMYLDIWSAATGDDRPEFLHIVQENEPPYVFEKIALSQEFIEFGRSAYRNALEKYCRCLKTGEWPGYAISPEYKVLNGWTYVKQKPWMETATAENRIALLEPEPEEDPEHEPIGITP